MTLAPLYDKVVVKQADAKSTTAGGLVLPEDSAEKPKKGVIIAVGPGLLLQNGETADMPLKVGDEVVFTAYGGNEVEFEGEKLLIMSANEVLAVVMD